VTQAAQRSAWARIACVLGDLVREDADAIVNAANTTLRGGGGVDGAIHRAAGPSLLAECIARYPHGCPTGEARITSGHGLAARHVIHAVGPVYTDGRHGEPELLAACYRRALELAAEARLARVSFAAISTGAYRYPWREAAEVSLAAIAAGLAVHPQIERVRVVLLHEELHAVFAAELAAAGAREGGRNTGGRRA
jgi:O-acetyl-ADP-ribose deacetylase (regulator of RNase III)